MGHDAEYSFVPASVTDKAGFYAHVLESLKGLLALEEGAPRHNWISALASVSSVLYNSFADFELFFGTSNRVNWAGFYISEGLFPVPSASAQLLQDPRYLTVGPYQGRPGCLRAPLKNRRKGVCASAFLSSSTVVVQNVHDAPDHIACDASTESEVVIPLVLAIEPGSKLSQLLPGVKGLPLGVLDIDCQSAGVWSEDDSKGLENIIEWLMNSSGVVDWTTPMCDACRSIQ